MRLIAEETLKKSIEKWLNPDPSVDRMVDIDDIAVSVMMEIEEQPTAYDVDKVVAELEKARAQIYRADGSIMCEKRHIEIDRAIQIVKGGGIDGD